MTSKSNMHYLWKLTQEDLIDNHIIYLPAILKAELCTYYGLKKKEEKTHDSEKSYPALYKTDDMHDSILFLTHTNLWGFFITLAVVANFTILSYLVCFMQLVSAVFEKAYTRNTRTTIIYVIFVLINYTDIIISTLHFYYKEIRAARNFPKKSITFLALDMVCLASAPIDIYSILTKNWTAFLVLLSFSTYRLYRAAQYFMGITKSPLRQGLKYVLFKYCILLYGFIHTVACGWMLLGCINNSCGDNIPHWTNVLYVKNDPLELYLYCLYVALTSVTNTGIGGATKGNMLEMLLIIVTIFYALFISSGVFLGAFTSIQIEGYKSRAIFGARIQLIVQQMKHPNISQSLRRKVANFFYNYWIKEAGTHGCNLIKSLPFALQRSITLDKYWYALNQSHLLRFTHVGLKRALSMEMYTIYFNQGDVILEQDVRQNKLFYIATGIIQVVAPDDLESPIITLGSGTCLGDVSLMLSAPNAARVVAASYCKVHVLEKCNMWKILTKYWKLEQSRIVHASLKFTLDNAKKQQMIKNKLLSQSKFVDKTLKLVKRKLDTKLNNEIRLKNNCGYLRECDTSDMYILNNTEISSGHKDGIFVTYNWPWILYPKTQLLHIWETIIFIYSFAVLIIYPLVLFYWEKNPLFYTNYMRPMAYILYVADIFLQLFTAIEDGHQNLTISLREIISTQVTRISFLIDVISIIPVEIISGRIGIFGRKIVECNHMLKIVRVLKYLYSISMSFKYNSNFLKIFLYVIYLGYLAYLQGVLYYVVACPERPCKKNSWVQLYKKSLNRDINIDDDSSLDILVVSILYGLLIISGTGGRFFIQRREEMITIFLFSWIFLLLYTYLLADYSATLTLAQLVRQEYFNGVNVIKTFMSLNKMKLKLINRMNAYLETQWYLTGGTRVKDLLNDVPLRFYEKINIGKFSYLINSVPLFQILDKPTMRALAGKCELEFFAPNEYILYAGSKHSNMYIIEKGFCKLISPGTEIKIGPQYSFGVIDMLLDIPSFYSIRTLTNVSILRISALDFYMVIGQDHNIKECLNKLINDTKNLMSVKRLFSKSDEYFTLTEEIEDKHPSFFYFHTGKLHPRNIDFQNGWSGYNLLRYFLFRRTILPSGNFLYGYVIFHAVVAYLSSLLNPSIFIFECFLPYYIVVAITVSLDALCLIDVYIRLHVGYYNSDGVLVTHPRCTAIHYLTTGFAVDLITALPLKILFNTFNRSKELCVITMIIKVLRAYRIPNGFAYYDRDILKNESILVNVMKYMAISMIILNTVSCFMVLIGCEYSYNPSTELAMLIPYNKSWVYTKQDGSAAIKKGVDPHPLSIYLLAMYYMITVNLQLGLGDCFCITLGEIAFVFVVILSGYLWFTYILVVLSNTKAILNENLTKYQNHMRDLLHFMSMHHVPKFVEKKCVRHFEYLWQRTQGTDTLEIFKNTSVTLKQDALLHLYYETLSRIQVFQNLELSFYRQLGDNIKQCYYLEECEILRINNIVDSVYIVHRGEVTLYGCGGHKFDKLGRGGMFGNFDNIPYIRSMITVVSKSTVDILRINTNTLNTILTKYPYVQKVLSSYVGCYIQESIPIDEKDEEITIEKGKLSVIQRLYMSRFMELVYMTISFVSFLIVTYHAAFQNHDTWVLIITFLLDCLHVIKIYFCFETPYISNVGEIVTNRKQIKRRYIKQKSLYLDLIALIPMEVLAFAISKKNRWWYISWLRLNRALRSLNIHDYFSVTDEFLNVNVLAIKLCSISVSFMIFIHTSTCIFYLSACPYVKCIKDSWTHDNANVYVCGLTAYICAMYYTSSMLTFTGYTTMLPKSQIDVILIIAMGLGAKLIVSIFISNMASVVRHYGYRLGAFSNQVNEMKKILVNGNISYLLQQGILKYCEQLWYQCKGRQMPVFLYIGPDSLTEEIKVFSFGDHIYQSIVFSDCHNDFLRLLILRCQIQIYFSGNKIVKQGDIDNTMYFINVGTVNVYSITADEELLVDNLIAPDSFGLVQGLYPNTPHTHTYEARAVTQLITLCLDDWYHLLAFYPASKFTIYSLLGACFVSLVNGNISYLLQQGILKYCEQLWYQCKGRQMPVFLYIGPDSLTEEIKVFSFGDHIYKSIVFSDCHNDFLRLLILRCQIQIYFSGNKIVKQGDIDNTMYFINVGTVNVYSITADEELLVDNLIAPDSFGLVQGLYPNTPHTHTYEARAVTQLITLCLDDWYHLLAFYPASKFTIYSLLGACFGQYPEDYVKIEPSEGMAVQSC